MSSTHGLPTRFDHWLVIGDDYRLEVALTDGGAALDITGASGVASICTDPGFREVAAPTVALLVAADGTLVATLDDAVTALLTPGQYTYAVQVTFADGAKRTVLAGRIDFLRVARA